MVTTKARVMIVVGTRPEVIKMAPVHSALLAEREAFETMLCVTAQHREMLDQALHACGLVPDIDLDLMEEGQTLVDVNAAVLKAMRGVIDENRPDIILVQGDTTTSMAAALAAFYAGVPVGHVEAGLRSGNMRAPFPEELNRRVTGMVASYHFAPTAGNGASLLSEGCDPASILVTGNTVVDALETMLERIDAQPALKLSIENALDAGLGFDWRRDRYVLVTGHRRENFSRGLQEICAAVAELADVFSGVHFVYPVHRNPAVRRPVTALLAGRDNVHLIEPLAYDAFLQALRNCHCVLTDSGGLQEEAVAIGKPVLVMRDVTERPEGVAAGGARLVGADRNRIIAAVSELLTDESTYQSMTAAINPYGDGMAGARIAAFLKRTFED